MAKKYKSTKLLKQSIRAELKPISAFGKHANRLADAKKKKIQKLSETQKRLLESKKNNKMIKISKKAKKFALLDEEDQEAAKMLSLTHKGVNVKDLKQFNDVDFNQSDLGQDEDFDQFQEKVNFAGFEATSNLLNGEQEQKAEDNKQKTPTEIYKEIIEKSKAYKMFRQQQYEKNFEMANELDQNFTSLVSQLKFRNRDQQLMQKLEHRDLQYDKLMNELKDDERVVSNKIVQKNEKYTQNMRKKKNEQLNKLMKDSDGEDEDVRGWVDGVESEEDEENDNQSKSEENQNEESNEQGDEQPKDDQDEGSYDELDDVQLSSEQQEQQENEGNEEGENQEVEGEDNVQDESSEEEQLSDDDEDNQGESSQEQDQQESEQIIKVKSQGKKSNIPVAKQKPTESINNKQSNNAPVSRSIPQKKRKLNFVD